MLDISCIAFMDDMLIYSTACEEHAQHVREVLDALRRAGLYVKLSKCAFNVDAVDFLGYRVTTEGITMNVSRIATVLEWPVPTSFRDIQVFLGFTNFFRRFIYRYSIIIMPITDLLKGMQKGRKTGPFEWTEVAGHAFITIKACFSTAPLLQHHDPAKEALVETDASGGGIAGIISQPCGELDHRGNPIYKPVAFWSRKLNAAEQNYGTPDQEMLAIVECFREWRPYLECPPRTVRVLTDHANLQHFMTTTDLDRRQAR